MENTHFYDGKLEKIVEDISSEIMRVQKIAFEEKQTAFLDLKKELMGICSAQEMKHLDRLISEKDKNYDPINHLDVDVLLYLCYEKIVLEKNNVFLEEFRIQLQDLHNGFCVQGRSVRLLQVLLAFSD